jgi:hypothetical protein
VPAPAPLSDFVRPVTFSAGGQQQQQEEGFVVAGPTITAGREGAIISGTTYTVLPSASGSGSGVVVAISDVGSRTLQASELAEFGIRTVAGSQGGYAFASQTLGIGGSAVVVSGATYSAVPQGSGAAVVVVAASGESSSTIAVAAGATTSIAGLGEVQVLDQPARGVYVLDGSVTISAGGAPVTVSNTVYSALPSGFGVLVAAAAPAAAAAAAPGGGGGGDGDDDFAPYIEQGVSGSGSGSEEGGEQQQGESYIIGAEMGSGGNGAGGGDGSVTTVAGIVYSALPSGSGVLVVADGTSRTVAVVGGPTGDADGGRDGPGRPTSTGNAGEDGPDETVVAYAGTASSSMGVVGWAGYLGVLVMVGTCLVR